MSAYIVEHETIQRILDGLNERNFWPPEYNLRPVEKGLGQALLDLNVLSVEERYGKGEAKKFGVPLTFVHVDCEGSQDDIQFLKTLKCYLYQSCEGRAEKTPLFSYLDDVRHQLEESIISELPQYETATWD
jgi:hypothetical protein